MDADTAKIISESRRHSAPCLLIERPPARLANLINNRRRDIAIPCVTAIGPFQLGNGRDRVGIDRLSDVVSFVLGFWLYVNRHLSKIVTTTLRWRPQETLPRARVVFTGWSRRVAIGRLAPDEQIGARGCLAFGRIPLGWSRCLHN